MCVEKSKIALILFYLVAANQSIAAETNSTPLELFGSEEFVSIAIGHEQPIHLAPAVANVITAEDIKNSGARDISDILNMVPGFHISLNQAGWVPIFNSRGLLAVHNRAVLFMIDGIPQTNIPTTNTAIDKIPIDIIERVEVSRGPSSSLYGADAYAGVVNIITKKKVPKHNEITLSGGSYNTKDGRGIFGQKFGDYNIIGAIEFFETDGHEPLIQADRQTLLDQIFGTNASLAPGNAHTNKTDTSFYLNISGHHVDWSARLSEQSNHGVGIGGASALDPFGAKSQQIFDTNFRIKKPINENLIFGSKFAYRHIAQSLKNLHFLPPGALGVFPNGIILNTRGSGNIGVAEGNIQYSGLTGHYINVGIGGKYKRKETKKESRNYNISDSGAIIPLGDLVNTISNPVLGVKPVIRNVIYLYFQDEWSILPDWTLTYGARIDKFNKFGTTINPRAAVVWSVKHDLTAKLLYGRGYREPTFAELELQQIPVLRSNPNIEPEVVNSIDFALDYTPWEDFRVMANIFYYKTEDPIRYKVIPNVKSYPENVQNFSGRGFELAAWWNISRDTKLYTSYNYQSNTEKIVSAFTGSMPRQKLFAMLQQKYRSLYFSTKLAYIADRRNFVTEAQPGAQAYTQVDQLIRWEFTPFSEITLDIRNLFNSDAREPSDGGIIPGDLVLPGRNYYLSLTLKF